MLPWKMPYTTSPSTIHPIDSIFGNSETEGTSLLNRRHVKHAPITSPGASKDKNASASQSRLDETWTKETVDAAMALTNMAGLNAARCKDTLAKSNMK